MYSCYYKKCVKMRGIIQYQVCGLESKELNIIEIHVIRIIIGNKL